MFLRSPELWRSVLNLKNALVGRLTWRSSLMALKPWPERVRLLLPLESFRRRVVRAVLASRICSGVCCSTQSRYAVSLEVLFSLAAWLSCCVGQLANG